MTSLDCPALGILGFNTSSMDIPDLKSVLGRIPESRDGWVGSTLNLIQFHPGCSKPHPAQPWTLSGIPSFPGNSSQPISSLTGKSFLSAPSTAEAVPGRLGQAPIEFLPRGSFLPGAKERPGLDSCWDKAPLSVPAPSKGCDCHSTLVGINGFSPEPEAKNTGTS